MRVRHLSLIFLAGYAFFFLAIFALPLSDSKEAPTGPLSQTFLRNFETYADQARMAWDVPGMAIGIVKDNKTVYAKGFGVKELSGTDKVTPRTLFEIGSISKSFTSALVAMMADEGRLDWDAPVINYMPDFVLYDPWVTRAFQIQDLLAQRSGLPQHAGDSQVYFGATRQLMINHLRYIKPVSSFRSEYAYQNSFFLVAGEILHAVSGRSWEELMKERIFAPLEMKSSNTSIKDYLASEDSSGLHQRTNGKVRKLSANYPYRQVYTIFGPAGGINSTVLDMAQWLKFQLNKGSFNQAPLVTADNLLRTRRSYIYGGKLFDADNYYGLGWGIRHYSPHPIIWHDGVTTGFANMLAFIPEDNIGIVILTNVRNTYLSQALALQFFDLYYRQSSKDWSQELLEKQILFERGKEKKKRPAVPESALPLERYAGVYFNEIYGKADVFVENEQLHILMGANRSKFALEHWNRDNFELLWPSLEEEEKIVIAFSIDENGYANQFKIPSLEDEKMTVLFNLVGRSREFDLSLSETAQE